MIALGEVLAGIEWGSFPWGTLVLVTLSVAVFFVVAKSEWIARRLSRKKRTRDAVDACAALMNGLDPWKAYEPPGWDAAWRHLREEVGYPAPPPKDSPPVDNPKDMPLR